jgi:ParB family chromosome partitioning protein
VAAKRRGLGSLIPGAEYERRAGDAQTVAVDLISGAAHQPRQQRDEDRLAELTESIRTHGLLQPVVVRQTDGGYQLIAGGRRLEAARRAGLTEVPVVLRECSDAETLELALVENLQREDLNAIESAQAYRQLIDQFHLSQEEVAQRVGRSRSAVSNSLRLLNLPSIIQQSLMADRISEGHARALLMVEDMEHALELWQRIEREGLSVREAEALARTHGRPRVTRESRVRSLDDPNVRALESTLQDALGTRVQVRPKGSGGMIEIEYYSEDDLDRIVTRIVRP